MYSKRAGIRFLNRDVFYRIHTAQETNSGVYGPDHILIINSYGPWVYAYSPLWIIPSAYANKNRKKTHRKLKMNEQPGLHHKMGAWTRCTGRALASSCGRTQHIGRQVHDSDRRTFEVMTLLESSFGIDLTILVLRVIKRPPLFASWGRATCAKS
jgi:hypothetical protein